MREETSFNATLPSIFGQGGSYTPFESWARVVPAIAVFARAPWPCVKSTPKKSYRRQSVTRVVISCAWTFLRLGVGPANESRQKLKSSRRSTRTLCSYPWWKAMLMMQSLHAVRVATETLSVGCLRCDSCSDIVMGACVGENPCFLARASQASMHSPRFIST
jgi:hypothetical protein